MKPKSKGAAAMLVVERRVGPPCSGFRGKMLGVNLSTLYVANAPHPPVVLRACAVEAPVAVTPRDPVCPPARVLITARLTRR